MNDIRQVWLDHFVVVIPGQDMAGDDQIAFTEWFGPRQEVRTVKVVDEGPQNFMYVANKSVDGMDGVLPEGEMQFHTDQCYYKTPSRATILLRWKYLPRAAIRSLRMPIVLTMPSTIH